MSALRYSISSQLWVHHGKSAWYFITLPKAESAEIKYFSSNIRSAWGSIRVTAMLGETEWKTSLFPNSKLAAYVLPVKAEIRRREKLEVGRTLTVQLEIDA